MWRPTNPLNVVFLVAVLIFAACGGKQVSKAVDTRDPSALPPNAAIFYVPADDVWSAIEKTLRYDFLFEFAVVNRSSGYFATALVRDYDDNVNVKSRISGSVKYDGTGIVVVLYNERQVQQGEGGAWQTIPSDYRLERDMLLKIKQKL